MIFLITNDSNDNELFLNRLQRERALLLAAESGRAEMLPPEQQHLHQQPDHQSAVFRLVGPDRVQATATAPVPTPVTAAVAPEVP